MSAASLGTAPSTPLTVVQRIEGGALAILTVVLFMLAGFAWWWLLVFFLVFDLSALGYLRGHCTGARYYNLVHNFTAPALLGAAFAVLTLLSIDCWPLGFVAGCWMFHVTADRAMGYGPRPDRA